jgi:hypothetical protein
MDKKVATQALLSSVRDLAAKEPDTKDWRAAYDKVAAAWDGLRDPDHGTTSTTIGEFFGSIGSGLIEAQKKLDKESESYVKRALRLASEAGEAMPGAATMFRIPRVNAELKCSLETTKEKKLNLIFYSDRQDVRELHQQTVNLEIVSVPASADYINALRAPAPAVPVPVPSGTWAGAGSQDDKFHKEVLGTLEGEIETVTTPPDPQPQEPRARGSWGVLTHADTGPDDEEDGPSALPPGWQGRIADAAARDEARPIIEQLDLKQNGQRRSLVKDRLLPSWSRAVIFTDGNNARFIALAIEGRRPELLLWQLILRPASLQLLYRLPAVKKAQRAMARILRVVADIGAAQEKTATRA